MKFRNIFSVNVASSFLNFLVIIVLNRYFEPEETRSVFQLFTYSLFLLPIIEFGCVEYLAKNKNISRHYLLLLLLGLAVSCLFLYSKNSTIIEASSIVFYLLSLLFNRLLFGCVQSQGKNQIGLMLSLCVPQLTKLLVVLLLYFDVDVYFSFSIASMINMLYPLLISEFRVLLIRKKDTGYKDLMYFGLTNLVITTFQRVDLMLAERFVQDSEVFNSYFLIANLTLVFQIVSRSLLTKYISMQELSLRKMLGLVIERQIKLIIPILFVLFVLFVTPLWLYALIIPNMNDDLFLCLIFVSMAHLFGVFFSPFESVLIKFKPNAIFKQKLFATTSYLLMIVILIGVSSVTVLSISILVFFARLVSWSHLSFTIWNMNRNEI